MRAAAAARRIVGAGPLDDDDGDVARRARRVAQDAVAADAIRRPFQSVVAVRQLDEKPLFSFLSLAVYAVFTGV